MSMDLWPTKEALEYRRKHFAVECEVLRASEQIDPSEFRVRTTHNGYQWSSITMTKSEAKAIIFAIRQHLKKEKTP